MIYVVIFQPDRGLFGQSPDPLYAALVGPPTRAWIRPTNEAIIISTPERVPNEVFARIQPHMVAADRLLVIGVHGPYGYPSADISTMFGGWVSAEVWNWLAGQVAQGWHRA